MKSLSRKPRLLTAMATITLLAVGCTSEAEKDQPPEWQSSPPEYLSCGGLTNPQLVVDLMVAADLGTPHRELTDSSIQQEPPRADCDFNRAYTLDFLVHQPDSDQLASSFAPPDTTTLPIPKLQGMVKEDYAYLYAPCTKQSETLTLQASMEINPPRPALRGSAHKNPEARLAMARLLVNAMNGSRAKFGCSETKLPLPTSLPNIPRKAKPKAMSHGDEPLNQDDTSNGRTCIIRGLPEKSPARGLNAWTVGSPEPSRLISLCEARYGDGFGQPIAAFVTYKGALAQARLDSDKYGMPRYDITCHGKPISYRLYIVEDGDYKRTLPPTYRNALEANATNAAEQAGCPLPD